MTFFQRIKHLDEKPEGAIELRRDQVVNFYDLVVSTWKPQSEIWALTFGPKILGAAGALSGMYGNMYFRKKLKLKNYGFFSTYLPNMVLPFLIVNTFHSSVVLKDIYLDPYGCTMCKGTKAAAIQLGLGLVQPLFFVPASVFMFATRHFTQRIPSPIYDRKAFYRFVGRIYRPLAMPMTINAILQILLAFFIVHMEENHFLYLEKAMVQHQTDDDASVDGSVKA